MELEKIPDPSNDKAMSELHKFISEWTERHELQGAKEFYYLGLYLTGRLNVQVKIESLKKDYKPVDYAARCEELIAHYGFVEFRQDLRNLLFEHGVASNPGWSEDDIIVAFRELLKGTKHETEEN
jgi:hypothetical protein